MIVAVSMGVLQKGTYTEVCDALSHDWIRLLDGMGVRPLLVPNILADPADYCRDMGISGVLLTSGNDIGRQPDEEWETSSTVAAERDGTEEALVRYALGNNIPLLGVCRGMQFVNTHFGGTLERDVSAHTSGERHVAVEHRVKLVDEAYRKTLGLEEFSTNSFHNHGVTLETLAPPLKVIAASDAGVVEALYHPELAVLGFQWHPERTSPDSQSGSKLFCHWLEECASHSGPGRVGETP